MTSPETTEVTSADEKMERYDGPWTGAPEPATETPPDALATALVESGAAPVEVDVNALLAQMKELQARVDSMSAAQGIPTDPIAAAVKDFRDHLQARKDSSPRTDFGVVQEAADALSEPPTRDETESLKDAFEELTEYCEGVDYLHKLAVKLHRQVVKG